MFSYRSEFSFSTFGSIDSSVSQAQLGREKGMAPPEDTSSFMALNLDVKKEFESPPSTLPKLEAASSLKTTVKKETKKKPPPPVVLLSSIVPKRGSLFLRTYARGKPKKIADLQIGDYISGLVKNQRTVNDDCDRR
jgi:hypothetical protein